MSVPVDLGGKLRQLRTARGFSQTELAKRIGVTPSTISQIESNMILPSLPALFKMAEMLAVDVGAFFRESATERKPVIVPSSEAVEMKLVDFPIETVVGRRLPLAGSDPAAEVYLIEIGPGKSLAAHFFRHKGDEIGYVLAGELQCTVGSRVNTAREGDLIHLTSELPSHWKNSGDQTARMLWVNVQRPR
jgi:transcriptional regulator with XRE-family HTH domain